MTRFLGALFLVLVLVAALGYYLDWFSFTRTDGPNQTHIEITVDKAKIRQDEETAKQKIKSTGERVGEKARELNDDLKRQGH